LPRNKNKIIKPPEIRVTLSDLMAPDFSFIAINRGIEPTISITAKSVKTIVSSSSILNAIKKALYEDTKLF
jgi:hypothetical protein